MTTADLFWWLYLLASPVCLSIGFYMLGHHFGERRGFRDGYTRGMNEAPTSRKIELGAALNEFLKNREKGPGAVEEMIAAGENAEIVEVEPACGMVISGDACHGCRYAGRYVVRGRAE